MKNVLIIGGSSDIGLSLSDYLNQCGYNVIVTYNQHKPNSIKSIKCDIRDEESIRSMFKKIFSEYTRIDILINMAAISLDSELIDKTKKEFMDVLEVNLVGPFLSSKIYSEYISDGMIINISSTDGIDTYSKYNLDYASSKGGLITLTKALSLSTSNKVLCVAPNWIDSDSTREMNQDYLNSELKRIKQGRLITKMEFNESINEIINMDNLSGSIFRIDIKGDKLWKEKI